MTDDLETRITSLERAIVELALSRQDFSDVEGHPFHGNQYSQGGGSSRNAENSPHRRTAETVKAEARAEIRLDKATSDRQRAVESGVGYSRLERIQETMNRAIAAGQKSETNPERQASHAAGVKEAAEAYRKGATVSDLEDIVRDHANKAEDLHQLGKFEQSQQASSRANGVADFIDEGMVEGVTDFIKVKK